MLKTAEKLLSIAPLGRQCNAWRVHEDEIVFIYGHFPTLTLEELHRLEAARAQGHRLVVGAVDAPAEVPELLAALLIVDAVVSLGESDLSDALEAVRPSVVIRHAEAPSLDEQLVDKVGSRVVAL